MFPLRERSKSGLVICGITHEFREAVPLTIVLAAVTSQLACLRPSEGGECQMLNPVPSVLGRIRTDSKPDKCEP